MRRQEYRISVKIEDTHISVGSLLGQRADLPMTDLSFRPVKSESAFPVRVCWKSALPTAADQRRAAERAVLDYCGRLFDESAYEGPVDCCL